MTDMADTGPTQNEAADAELRRREEAANPPDEDTPAKAPKAK